MLSSALGQYAIRGVVRYYGWLPKTLERARGGFIGRMDLTRNVDVSRWTIPPHVRLANLPTYDAKGTAKMTPDNDLKLDASSAEAFLKRYGVLYRQDYQQEPTFKKPTNKMTDASQPGPKRVAPEVEHPGNLFKESIGQFAGAQFLLRKAWTGDTETITEHFNDGTLSESFRVASFDIQNRSGEVLLETEDLWEYMRYLFLVDYAEKRTGVCERQDCPTPYFIQQRKGQRYCSHDCAVLENVRRFRSKARKK